jgi:hypothetical protein
MWIIGNMKALPELWPYESEPSRRTLKLSQDFTHKINGSVIRDLIESSLIKQSANTNIKFERTGGEHEFSSKEGIGVGYPREMSK